MSIRIPANNQWTQNNSSDILGMLQGTFNVDLNSMQGELGVTRTIQTTTQATNTDMTSYPVGFVVYNDGTNTKLWTVAGSKAHSATNTTKSSFAVDATSGTPTDCDSTYSDIALFKNAIFITANQKLYIKTSGSWYSNAITGAGPWMMTAFGDRLYIAICGISQIYSTSDGATITTSSTYTLTFNTTASRITFLRSASNRIWIGFLNIYGGKGRMAEWDGVSTQITRDYKLDSAGALACVIKDDVPWIIDAEGKLLTYSNGTFIEKARLPIDRKILTNATNTVNNRFIHPNGMTIVDGKINILINNKLVNSDSSISEYCPSGVWEFDEQKGLYHKYSLSYLPIGTNTVTDYGQIKVSGVGGLFEAKLSDTNAGATGNLLAGATVYTDASSTDAGVWTNDTFDAVSGTTGQYNTNGIGYIVLPKILSTEIKDVWEKIFLFHTKFAKAEDTTKVKYRTYTIEPTEISITWTSTSTFTTTTNVLTLEGYEVEVIQGTGSGKTAHITQIDVTGSTYTIHLDDTFSGATGTAKAKIRNWKLGSTITTQDDQITHALIDTTSMYIELKIEFDWCRRNKLFGLLLINKAQQLIK